MFNPEAREGRTPLPVEEIYGMVNTAYNTLSEFYSKTNEKGVPKVSLWNGDKQEYFPDFTDEEKKISDDLQWALVGGAAAVYSEDGNIILFGGEEESTPEIVAHETTHSIIRVPEGKLHMDILMHSKVSGSIKDLIDKNKLGLLRVNRPENEILNLDEFFPPISEAFLRGDASEANLNFWREYFEHLQEYPENILGFTSFVAHLPQIAGGLLMQQYKGDAGKFMREHPDVIDLKGEKLWAEYCVPQLGKFFL